jgi:fatty acid-binding protein DegV
MTIDELHTWLLKNRLRVATGLSSTTSCTCCAAGAYPAGTAVLGTALGIKPVLHVDTEGRLVNIAKARGRRKAMSMLIDDMKSGRSGENGGRVFVVHGDCEDDATFLAGLPPTPSRTRRLKSSPSGRSSARTPVPASSGLSISAKDNIFT